MAEKHTSSPIERPNMSPETPDSIEAAGRLAEQLERRAEQAERTVERPDTARQEAIDLAQSTEGEKDQRRNDQEATPQQQPITKQDINARYRQTLKQVQSQLSAPSRTFSKVIHHPVVEKTSEALGNTVARPNLLVTGALGAIVISLAAYFIAKLYGYTLSGFESIGSFALGWLIGAIIEYARLGFRRRSSKR